MLSSRQPRRGRCCTRQNFPPFSPKTQRAEQTADEIELVFVWVALIWVPTRVNALPFSCTINFKTAAAADRVCIPLAMCDQVPSTPPPLPPRKHKIVQYHMHAKLYASAIQPCLALRLHMEQRGPRLATASICLQQYQKGTIFQNREYYTCPLWVHLRADVRGSMEPWPLAQDQPINGVGPL